MTHLLCFGLGLSAHTLAPRLARRGWTISATSRSKAGFDSIQALGFRALYLDGDKALPTEVLDGVTHVLVSAPPDERGDIILRNHGAALHALGIKIKWLGYLSTTGVYGNHGGGLVTEETPLTPNTTRGHYRLLAETQWLDAWHRTGLPVHVFRLAGIYGPGRNQLISLLDGSAKRVIKEGQIFSRIHAEDIASALEASIAQPRPGRAYNVCDDEPCPPQDVVEFGARLLGLPVPPAIPFDEANLSPMALSFYADSKRVSNRRIKTELGVKLAYPSYREGLTALAAELKR
ncbi:SDR family oxidoreductase [Aestuariivirga sp.]|jgi:nucleoside-diphosphate-sugar epimerase|uniref:SDR family oxidoreductase n=1 Tax=Aestuariivirga sp. TaxID=2650926 RepID=UPI0037833770